MDGLDTRRQERASRRLKAPAVLLLALLATGPLAGCSSVSGFFGDTKTASIDNPDPPEALYKEADALLGKGRFEKAAKKFEEVDRYHPYSPFARKSIVMAAYAYFKAKKFPEAVQSARRYTTLHPGTKEAALAHHIIASSYFEQIQNADLDQSQTKKALAELRTLVRRFPNSPYARKAVNRIRIAEDVLAAHEMKVGRFYLKRKNYLAAINRFRTVVTDYQTTRHVEEALMRLTEAYMALGIKREAQMAAAVLGHNYPNSPWYKDAYVLLQTDGLVPRESKSSWMAKAWSGTIKTVKKLNPF